MYICNRPHWSILLANIDHFLPQNFVPLQNGCDVTTCFMLNWTKTHTLCQVAAKTCITTKRCSWIVFVHYRDAFWRHIHSQKFRGTDMTLSLQRHPQRSTSNERSVHVPCLYPENMAQCFPWYWIILEYHPSPSGLRMIGLMARSLRKYCTIFPLQQCSIFVIIWKSVVAWVKVVNCRQL